VVVVGGLNYAFDDSGDLNGYAVSGTNIGTTISRISKYKISNFQKMTKFEIFVRKNEKELVGGRV
jgi:hypothetical protein